MSLNPSRVPAFPISPSNPFSGPGAHPIPIALGEVRKLCEIEKSCVGADFESICETSREPLHLVSPAEPDPITAGALRVPPSSGISGQDVLPRVLDGLRYPLFELLSPSVVIRRRPKRVQSLGIT